MMKKIRTDNLLLSVFLSIVSCILLRNAYLFSMNNRLILVMAFVASLWIVLGLCCEKFNSVLDDVKTKIRNFPTWLKKNKKNNLNILALIVGVTILTVLISIVCIYVFKFSNNYIVYLTVFSVVSIFAVVFHYWNNLYEQLHKVFFSCVMISGVFFITCAPVEVVMNWDEQIHFNNALQLVDVLGGYSVEADDEVISHVFEQRNEYYSEESRASFNQYYNDSYNANLIGEYKGLDISAVTVAYIPYAVGIIIGRGLLLPYTTVFRLAKIVNLLVYALLISLAVKKSRHSKIIYAGIGAFPTVVFMASSFSYDPWVLSFILLGYSIYQEAVESGKITRISALKMGVCFFLGILVKAVYFPVLIPLLFAPSSVFENEKQKKYFRLYIVGLMTVLLMSFALPMLIDSGSRTDTRGGIDVNSAEQVKFILMNPIQYAVIFFRFLFTDYLIPSHSYGYMQAYGYLGSGITNIVPLILLIGLMFFTEKNGYSTRKTCIVAWISCFLSLALVVTALYVSYTPVGHNSVNGCQYRYLIPLLYPVMSSFSGGMKNLSKFAGKYGTVFIMFMSLSFVLYMGKFMYIHF